MFIIIGFINLFFYYILFSRGIDNGKDLSKDFLEDLYDKIVKQEIAMNYERDDFAHW